MMVVGLLLAQLVLPGPPSGPIQPPGMICLGECAGPVVWGPAERGRLVVACDMRSDTCSDGRRITTQRATPVPCETSPGVWEILPADRGCYSVRGLESWGQNTSYLSWGAELDRSPWQAVDGATVQSLPTGGYRVIGTGSNSRIMQLGIPAVPGPHTLSCIARSVDETPQARMRIYWDASSPGSVAIPVTTEWAVHSITATVPEEWDGNISIHVYSRTGTVDVIGCWLTRTSTPGRPCWGGEAPVTCAADRHTISTEGWPTEAGEVSVVFSLGQEQSASDYRYLIDGRGPGGVPNVSYVYIRNDRISVQTTEGTVPSGVLTWEVGRTYHVRVRVADGSVYLYRDGLQIGTGAGTFLPWSATALIGRGIWSVGEHINGSISSLRIRSSE